MTPIPPPELVSHPELAMGATEWIAVLLMAALVLSVGIAFGLWITRDEPFRTDAPNDYWLDDDWLED